MLLNWQTRSNTGIYPSISIHPLLCKGDLISTLIFLNNCERQYAYLQLSFSDQQLIKDILPISLRKGDGAFQQGELPENNLIQPENTKRTLYWQYLAWKITIEYLINLADGVKLVKSMKSDRLKRKIVISAKNNAIVEAKKYQLGLVM